MPVSIMASLDSTLNTLSYFTILRFLKIFRVFRLLRLDFIEELEHKGVLSPSFDRMLKFLVRILQNFKNFVFALPFIYLSSFVLFGRLQVMFLFSLHVITCFFWLVMENSTLGDESSPLLGTWGDVSKEDLEGSLGSKYVLGFYWALIVSLGNDFDPESMGQRAYSTAILVAGIFIYAIIVGSASSLMTSLDHVGHLRKRQMDDINYYMQSSSQKHRQDACRIEKSVGPETGKKCSE